MADHLMCLDASCSALLPTKELFRYLYIYVPFLRDYSSTLCSEVAIDFDVFFVDCLPGVQGGERRTYFCKH